MRALPAALKPLRVPTYIVLIPAASDGGPGGPGPSRGGIGPSTLVGAAADELLDLQFGAANEGRLPFCTAVLVHLMDSPCK
jgi:hypothetical protein